MAGRRRRSSVRHRARPPCGSQPLLSSMAYAQSLIIFNADPPTEADTQMFVESHCRSSVTLAFISSLDITLDRSPVKRETPRGFLVAAGLGVHGQITQP